MIRMRENRRSSVTGSRVLRHFEILGCKISRESYNA